MRTRPRRPASRAGFTLVEVLMALGIMTIGAMALMGFQQQVARSNRYARDLSTATQVAENWLERLKVDARAWTISTGRAQAGWPNQALMLANTQWLRQLAAGNAYQTIAINPAAGGGTPGIWNAADMDGIDVNPALGTHRYCVSVRLNWVYYGSAMRAEVRVWWPKDYANVAPAALGIFGNCADNDAALSPAGASVAAFHVVYMSTVLRRNEQGGP